MLSAPRIAHRVVSKQLLRAATLSSSVCNAKMPPSLQAQQQIPQANFQQIRCKHSQRQIKRLFRKHPAILRVEARQGIDRTPDAPPPPKFEAVFEPKILHNGWSAPPPSDWQRPEYPFTVTRTKNKPNNAAGFLPVYSTFRYVSEK